MNPLVVMSNMFGHITLFSIVRNLLSTPVQLLPIQNGGRSRKTPFFYSTLLLRFLLITVLTVYVQNFTTAQSSCYTIKLANPSAPDGVYSIDPDGTGGDAPVLVYCDMTTEKGGWTLVASTLDEPVDDQANSYSSNISTLNPTSAMAGIWDGMRPLITGNSDIRFSCNKTSIGNCGTNFTVDLLFYDIHWYDEITTGTDAQSCFEESNGSGDTQPTPKRKNLINGQVKNLGDLYDASYLEGEDSCDSPTDFTVDFDDRGMDSNQSDGTDWGRDDNSRKCGTSSLSGGKWFIWVREAEPAISLTPVGEINVQGNGQDILDGDNSPSVADNTDFGSTTTSTPQSSTFTIQNSGLGQIGISNVEIVGSSEFAVTTQPVGSIIASGSSNFVITYTPTNAGADNAIVRICNTDSNEGQYTFSITGVGSVACNIEINSVTPTDESCDGENDGALSVVAACSSCVGGDSDIRYSIDGSDFTNTTGEFLNLADGTYTVTIRDVNTPTCTEENIIDGVVGQGDPNNTYYLDADGDGFGDPNSTAMDCALPNGYVTNADDCNDAIASLSNMPTYTHDGVCYETLADAITATNGTGIIRIEADAVPSGINTIPTAVTIEVLAGACWTNNLLLTNNGTIELIGTGKFINDTDGIYTGTGSFIGNLQNNGTVKVGN